MSRLVMVRHGQATIQGPEYDALSPLGHEQTKRLGQFWKSQNVQFDHVFIGPRRRHRETWDQIAQELENPPQPVYLEELDEHSGQRVFLAWMKEKSPELPELKTMIREFQSGSAEAQKEFLKLFRRCTDDWVNKGFTAEGVETWPEFTARVTTGIEKVKALSGRAKTVAVFPPLDRWLSARVWPWDSMKQRFLS